MGFPEELKKLKRWVGYRLVPDKDGGKPRKRFTEKIGCDINHAISFL